MKCQLCERDTDLITEHHLVPKSEQRRGGQTIFICSACHRQLHHIFTNDELARQFDNPDKIKKHPEMRKFLKWVRNQDPNKRIKVKSRKK